MHSTVYILDFEEIEIFQKIVDAYDLKRWLF